MYSHIRARAHLGLDYLSPRVPLNHYSEGEGRARELSAREYCFFYFASSRSHNRQSSTLSISFTTLPSSPLYRIEISS